MTTSQVIEAHPSQFLHFSGLGQKAFKLHFTCFFRDTNYNAVSLLTAAHGDSGE